MEKQFKLAFLGVKPGDPEDMIDSIGIRSYTVNAEKILDIVQNLGPAGKLNDKLFGISPEQNCGVMMGGRGFPFFSRDEIVQIIKDVDVIVISPGLDYYYRAFLMWLTPENLPKSCIVVLRLPFTEEDQPYGTRSASDLLKDMGMNTNGDIINKKGKRKSKKKGKTNFQIFPIGLSKYGGIEPQVGIPQLQAALFQEEIAEEILKPVKETVSAGKSLFGWGRSFTNWMSRLVH